MNRPTRNTLFGCAFCLILAVLGSCEGHSQTIDATATTLARRFNECVLTASLGIPGERNAAAEMAFAACQTEEQAIRVYLGSLALPRGNAEMVIVNRKLALKKTILQDPQ